MADIGANLQQALNRLSLINADGAYVANLLTGALQSNSNFATQLNEAADSNLLKDFGLSAPSNTGATANSSTGVINFNVNELRQLPLDSAIFVTSHETQHLVDASEDNSTNLVPVNIQQSTNAFQVGIGGDQPDYTALINADQNVHANDESMAQIAGWNAYVNAMSIDHPGFKASDLYNGSYLAHFFVDDAGNPLKSTQRSRVQWWRVRKAYRPSISLRLSTRTADLGKD